MAAALPWARPRHELLLLVLVAVAALTPIYRFGEQDRSRLCLTEAIGHGRLANDACLAPGLDRASFGGHLYSDKPPGMSLLELPAAAAVRLGPPERWASEPLRLWGVRVLSSGVAFLACVLLAGRLAEGLAPGLGAPALVAFALGTLVAPLGAGPFGHVAAAALGFGAFVLAWRRRPLAAGLLAGTAVLFEYQAALVAAILAAYVAASGLRALLRFAAGCLPAAALLGAYDTAAFGSPWHLSYRYVANRFAEDQARGLFGIGVPHAFSSYLVAAGGGGLLVISPVVVAAAFGLVLLGRSHRREALVCGAVGVAFLALNCGYFLAYGGFSPGPRFLVPALPFVALGLGPAFARAPRLTGLLAAVSIVATTVRTLTWNNPRPEQQTLWGDIARVPYGVASTAVTGDFPRSWPEWLGFGRGAGVALVAAAALAAAAVSLRGVAVRRGAPLGRARAAVAAAACAITAAVGAGVAGWPYDYRGLAPASLEAAGAPLRCPGGAPRPAVEQGVLRQRAAARPRALRARGVEAPHC